MSGDKICAHILSSFRQKRNEDKMRANIVQILYEFCTNFVPTSWHVRGKLKARKNPTRILGYESTTDSFTIVYEPRG